MGHIMFKSSEDRVGGRNLGNVCGGNLKKVRKLREMSQQELANEAQLMGLQVTKKRFL